MYEARISEAIQGKEKRPPLYLGVVAIKKGSPRGALDYGRPTYLRGFKHAFIQILHYW